MGECPVEKVRVRQWQGCEKRSSVLTFARTRKIKKDASHTPINPLVIRMVHPEIQKVLSYREHEDIHLFKTARDASVSDQKLEDSTNSGRSHGVAGGQRKLSRRVTTALTAGKDIRRSS